MFLFWTEGKDNLGYRPTYYAIAHFFLDLVSQLVQAEFNTSNIVINTGSAFSGIQALGLERKYP